MTVGIIAAHPDDEVLGCGATAALAAQGEDVRILILGEGATSRASKPGRTDRQEVARLRSQARKAAAVLGAKDVALEGLPDNRFDTLALLDVVKVVEKWVARARPRVVYTHSAGDLNIDHGITARAVMTATRPGLGAPVEEVYSFEVPSATEWAFQRIEPSFRPNVFVDVTRTIDAKIEAMQVYEGEVRPFPHPRSPEALRTIARRWGTVAAMPYAEAFELVRALR